MADRAGVGAAVPLDFTGECFVPVRREALSASA